MNWQKTKNLVNVINFKISTISFQFLPCQCAVNAFKFSFCHYDSRGDTNLTSSAITIESGQIRHSKIN